MGSSTAMSTYVFDANAIRVLDYDYISARAMRDRMITVDDVKFEVEGLVKVDLFGCFKLSPSGFAIMAEILEKYESVRRLLNYVEYEGAADVAILAYVLTANDGQLIPDEHIVVTEDKNLQSACDELKISWLNVDKFKQI